MKKPQAEFEIFRDHSLVLHDAQKQLKILSSLRWSGEFESKFLEQGARPHKTSVHHRYEPRVTLTEKEKFRRLIEGAAEQNQKVVSRVSPDVAEICGAISENLDAAFHLRQSIGTAKFGTASKKLYGSLHLPNSKKRAPVVEVAHSFSKTLSDIGDTEIDALYPKILSADALAAILRERLRDAHLIESVDIIVTDQLTADAAAGSRYVKLKKSAKFSLKDADVLLYHEIFTHVVTSLNGQAQTHAAWLGFDTPRCTTTQEGLAVFLEVISGKTYPRRLRKIVDRIILLEMISNGEECGHLYDWLRERRYSHKDSLGLIIRAFRGMAPGSREPFTKDLAYLQGLINVFNFLKVNLIKSRYDCIEMLYSGKLDLNDIGKLCRLRDQGIVERPRWVPPQFLNLDGMVTWFSCVLAFGSLNDEGMQSKFSV